MVLFLFLNFHVRRISICYDNKYAGFCLTSEDVLHALWSCPILAQVWNKDQGFEIRTGPYGPTGETSNRLALQFVYGEEPFHAKKVGTRTNHSLTIRFYEP